MNDEASTASLTIDTILCIIDPTTNQQRALQRAEYVARQSGAKVRALLCFTPPAGTDTDDGNEFQAAEHRRHELWVEDLVKPLKVADIDVSIDLRASPDWRDAISAAVRDTDADLVIKATSPRSALRRRLMKTSDWLVLRESSVPVLFVKRSGSAPIERVLAAVNITARDDAHVRLTDMVLATGRDAADQLGAELHVVNAYVDSKNFIHPPDLAKRAGVERQRAHVGDADPEDLIAEISEKIDASLVVIGSVGRKGMAAAVVGNTAERILDTVTADILTLVTPASGR